jgi:thiamine pyrophosphokinase
MRTVVVFASGPGPVTLTGLPRGAKVIAADGGAELARQLGFSVDLAVGDFDSVPAETLATIASVERHPAAKDATDLELALEAALRFSPERVLVVGSAGGRLDHLFGAMLLLAADAYSGVQVDAHFGTAAVHVVRAERALRGAPGELVSLFALNGPANDVVTDGLVYPLRGEVLEPGSSRGVSNVFAGRDARVTVGRGVLLVVRPAVGRVLAGG